MRVVLEESFPSYVGFAKGAEHNLVGGEVVEHDFEDWRKWLATALATGGERHEELTLTVEEADGTITAQLWNDNDVVTRQFMVLCQDEADHNEALARLQEMATAKV